jgi:hypothetical protein
MGRIGSIIYVIIGLAVAANKDYLGDIGSLGDFINLVLAVILWPLVLFGVDFKIKIGGGDDKDKKGSMLLIGPAVAYGWAALTTRIGNRD